MKSLYRLAVLGESAALSENLHLVGPALESLGRAVTEVRVSGETVVQLDSTDEALEERSGHASASLSHKPDASLSPGRKSLQKASKACLERHSGRPGIYIHLSELDAAIRQSALPPDNCSTVRPTGVWVRRGACLLIDLLQKSIL